MKRAQQLKVLMGSVYVCGDDRHGIYLKGNDPNGFGLGLITSLASWHQLNDDSHIPAPLTRDDVSKVRLYHSYGNEHGDGGYYVTVVAPIAVWRKAKKAFNRCIDSLVSSEGLLV